MHDLAEFDWFSDTWINKIIYTLEYITIIYIHDGMCAACWKDRFYIDRNVPKNTVR